MKIGLDSAIIDKIGVAARWGLVDGVTTNPSLFAKVAKGASYESILAEVCTLTSVQVSAEVVAGDVEGMLSEGRTSAKIAPYRGENTYWRGRA